MYPALLCQSILLIISQLLLLSICLHYRPQTSITTYAPLSPLPDASHPRPEGAGSREGRSEDYLDRETDPDVDIQIHGGEWSEPEKKRPFNFWQWDGLGRYLEFLAGLILVLGILQVIFARWEL